MTGFSEEIIAILKLIDSSSCEEVRLEVGELKIHVRRSFGPQEPGLPSVSPSEVEAAPPSDSGSPLAEPVAGAPITAPMVGTFYRASAPGAPPFVEEGDLVSADTVVCIVEAMKVMNYLKAGTAGRIAEIRADDGDLVEYGQRLFTVVAEGR